MKTKQKTVEEIVEELQTCPFCGSKAQKRLTKVKYCQLHGDSYQDHIIGCFNSQCPVQPKITHCNERCAVTEWNTRQTLQAERQKQDEMVEKAWEYCVKAVREESGSREDMKKFITHPITN